MAQIDRHLVDTRRDRYRRRHLSTRYDPATGTGPNDELSVAPAAAGLSATAVKRRPSSMTEPTRLTTHRAGWWGWRNTRISPGRTRVDRSPTSRSPSASVGSIDWSTTRNRRTAPRNFPNTNARVATDQEVQAKPSRRGLLPFNPATRHEISLEPDGTSADRARKFVVAGVSTRGQVDFR